MEVFSETIPPRGVNVSNAGDMVRHAGTLYRRAFRRAERPIERLEAEAKHLHEIEHRGEAGATPFIAIGGLILFLLPIVLAVLGLAFLAYYVIA
jgi:hypothetical protein